MRYRVAFAITLALLSGCASSSYVGKWAADHPAGDTKSVNLDIKSNGTFTGSSDAGGNTPDEFTGTWQKGPNGEAVLTIDGDKTVVAKMVDAKNMTVDDKNESTQFKRQP